MCHTSAGSRDPESRRTARVRRATLRTNARAQSRTVNLPFSGCFCAAQDGMLLRVRLFCPHPSTGKGLHTVDELYIAETRQSPPPSPRPPPTPPAPFPVLCSDGGHDGCVLHAWAARRWMDASATPHNTNNRKLISDRVSIMCVHNPNNCRYYSEGKKNKNQQLPTAFCLERSFWTLHQDAGLNCVLTTSRTGWNKDKT